MLDLAFGDICVCDLTFSMNSPKTVIAPLIFLSATESIQGIPMYRFCRIGKEPEGTTSYPYIAIGDDDVFRKHSAIYPTQTVLFTGAMGIKRKTGAITNEDTKEKIKEIIEKERTANKAIVMSLCPRCKRDFMRSHNSILRRLDPFSEQTYQCDFCQTRNGYMYVIYSRKTHGKECR
ncbi:MAG: hypothetical protein IJ091_10115 [Oscillospiraceae bacterium]|nr:hypothetical protein [Oscillospiraceae bacterium]